MPRNKKFGFWRFMGHFALTVLTGGVWLLFLLYRFLVVGNR